MTNRACQRHLARALPAALVTALILSILDSGVASAQVLTTVEFSFSNPGARSMGFGGAFAALADDATAAFANPAGLVQITEPEISIEGRSWRYSSAYTAGGRAAGEPTGIGIDTVAFPLRTESNANLTGVSFVSLVYPAHSWSFAFYQHQLMNFELTQEIQGIFERGAEFAGAWRGPIERGFFDFEITTRALAAGYRVNDRLSLGLGLSYFDPTLGIDGADYLPDDDTQEGFFANSSFLPQRLSERVRFEGSDGDWGLAGGFLWSLARNWKLGGVYREGPELEIEANLTAGPVHPDLPTGQQVFAGSTPWSLPDVYGLGLAYRSPDGHWTAGLEWTRVEYSTVFDSLGPELASGSFITDADELHLGAEYAFFAGSSVVAIRLGAWHDPDHSVQHLDPRPFAQAEAVPGENEVHLAAGFGVAVEDFQMDLGIDLSQRRDTASLSAIYSF